MKASREQPSSQGCEVLGIACSAALRELWRGWFAPATQPFRVDLMVPELVAAVPQRCLEPTPEWCDTYFMYSGTWTWLDEAEFWALGPRHRRSLMAIRRRTVQPKQVPVWPSQLLAGGDEVLFTWIASGTVRPSRHQEVPREVWDRAATVLPLAQQIAGTFPDTGSGPNCFGTVMAAAGEPTADILVPPDRFTRWTEEHSEPVQGTRCDDEPGTVFVWTEHGQVAHAAVSLGSGWMLTKPSQSWSSPRLVSTVRYAVSSWRYPKTRLSRHRIRR